MAESRENIAMKVMVASDIHLGYKEKDRELGDDSFNTFEEVLQIALQEDVDLILLGGDLFHDNNPSTSTINRCLRLLRTYCMGDKAIEIEFLSDQSTNFKKSLSKTVNYEDPNLNISIPVFTIHGNHDDPSGFGNLSTLDLLSTTGLVNYFGSWEDITKIQVDPILLKKNDTKLAIYGLGYIHDNRLHRLFEDYKVVTNQPIDSDSYFNIFVVHQNRAQNRGEKNSLPEESLPSFANLIIWGHEHDQRMQPEKNAKKNFHVCQPGSTVATSLAKGESIQKECAVFYFEKDDFMIKRIPLKTVRPFEFYECRVTDALDEDYLAEGGVHDKVRDFAKKKVNEMIVEAHKKYTDHPKQPRLPLIRLRLEVTEADQMFHPVQFGQDFTDKVANPSDIVIFSKKFEKVKLEVELDQKLLKDAYDSKQSGIEVFGIEDVIAKYFEEVSDKHKLKVMSVPALQEMTRLMIKTEEKGDDRRNKIIDFYFNASVEYLGMAKKDEIPEKMITFTEQHSAETFNNLITELEKKKTTSSSIVNISKTKAGESSSRGTRGGRGRGKNTVASTASRSKATPIEVESRSRRERQVSKAIYISSDDD